MSDKEATNAYDANIGITLPGNSSATNNGGLSPLFLGRIGVITVSTVYYRGVTGRLYANNPIWDTFAYYLSIYTDVIWPSSKDSRRESYPLRCLVSTTNSYI